MADGGACWGDAGALRDGYERLRAAVLSGSASGWRLGHGVLCARGMAGWMNAFGELAPPARERPGDGAAGPTASASSCPAGAEVVSLPGTDEVVAVLAQMTLAIAA